MFRRFAFVPALVVFAFGCTSADFSSAEPGDDDATTDDSSTGDASRDDTPRPGDDTARDSDASPDVVVPDEGIDVSVPDADAPSSPDAPPSCVGKTDGTPCSTSDPARHICLTETCVPSVCGDRFVDVGRGEDCDDGNAIAGDGCEPTTCKFSCKVAGDCDDKNVCTKGETCDVSHVCTKGTATGDGTPCTLAGGGAGVCHGTSCASAGCGNCTTEGSEKCDDCNTDDTDGCKSDCTYTCTTDADCSDRNVCTGTETCNTSTHKCVAGTALGCSGAISCTIYGCDPVSGCTKAPDNSKCVDSYSCTIDACNTSAGCTNVADSTRCTAPFGCYDEACLGAAGGDPGTGCKGTPNNAKCTGRPACFDNACVGSGGDGIGCSYTSNPAKCTAMPSCFDRGCVATGGDSSGCTYAANIGKCTAKPSCFSRTCTAIGGDGCSYTAVDSTCADAYACTVDKCSETGATGTGCSSTPVNTSCDDAVACTIDTCSASAGCTASSLPPVVTCDAATGTRSGCKHAMIDADLDGYAPFASCALSKSAAADCNDNDPAAHPLASYSDVAMKSGYDPALASGPADATASSWDFNCNGISDLQLKTLGSCFYSSATGGCKLVIGWQTSVPACGATGTFIDGCDTAGGTFCTTSASVMVQSCR